MGLIQNLLRKTSENKKEFKEKFKQAEMDLKIQRRLEEREKSSNERELEAHIKRLREDDIKRKLDVVHKQQNKENWKGSFNVLKKEKSILTDDRPILKEKNIFLKQKNIFLNKKPKSKLNKEGGLKMKEERNKPKKDGSGRGIRANKGRGGCELSKQSIFGKGKKIAKDRLFGGVK